MGMLYSTETFRRRNSVHFNCNDPETAKLIELVRGMAAADGLIVDHWFGNCPCNKKCYCNTMIGTEVVEWLIKSHAQDCLDQVGTADNVPDKSDVFSYGKVLREGAISIGRRMVFCNLIKHTANEHDFHDRVYFFELTHAAQFELEKTVRIIDT